MKKLSLYLIALSITIISVGFLNSAKVTSAATNLSTSVSVHELPKNDVVMTPNMTPENFLSQVLRQYKHSYPNFEGTVKAYTPEQYQALQKGKQVEGITSEYLSKMREHHVLQAQSVSPVSNPNVAPFSSVGVVSVWFSLPNGIMIINSPYLSGGTTGGTGFSIGVNRIGTAAHILYSQGHYIAGGIVNFGDSRPNHSGVGYGILTKSMVPQQWISHESPYSSDYAAALVSIKSGKMPAALSLNTHPSNQQQAKSIGFPGDPQSGYELQGVMVQSSGVVNAYAEDPLGVYVSQQVKSYHGMSGGPLLDSNNSVIGINILAWPDTHNIEYQWGFRRMNDAVAGFLINN